MAGVSLVELHEATGGHVALYYAVGQHMARTGATYEETLDYARRQRWMRRPLTAEQHEHLGRLLGAGTSQGTLF